MNMTWWQIFIDAGLCVLGILALFLVTFLLTNRRNLHGRAGKTITAGPGAPGGVQIIEVPALHMDPHEYRYIFPENDPKNQ